MTWLAGFAKDIRGPAERLLALIVPRPKRRPVVLLARRPEVRPPGATPEGAT